MFTNTRVFQYNNNSSQCVYAFDNFLGVYSSLRSVHRDALRYCNRGLTRVYMVHDNKATEPSLVKLRNTFKGKCDFQVEYRTDSQSVKIYKTKIKE